MKFMLLMYADPEQTKAMSAAAVAEMVRKHEALHAQEAGTILNGAGLRFPEDTTTLRLGDDGPITGTGPLMPASEHLTAYYVLECADAGQACTIAERILDYHVTAVEIREIHDWFGMGPPPAGRAGAPRSPG